MNWNQRTYRIDLTASSTTTQTIKTPYDIVLVLDQSSSMRNSFVEHVKFTGSMNSYPNTTYYIKTRNGIYQQLERAIAGGRWPNYNYTWSYKDSYTGNTVTVDQNTTDVYVESISGQTKIEALKKAATQFVNNVDQKNSDCRVGIVTFADKGDIKSITRNNYTLAKVGTSKEAILNTIKNLYPSGNTHPASGLDEASRVFSDTANWEKVNQTTGRKKMVVFLTDGVPAPRGTADFDESLANAGTASAGKLHEAGVEVYALGIFDAAKSTGNMNNVTVQRVDKYMQSIASSPDKYMTADSVDSLSSIFENITNNIPVTATVKDVIDSRFELTAESRKQLEADGAKITDSADGPTTIIWEDTPIPGKKGSGTTEIEKAGWHTVINIKAKDDFIGGNMIPTNGAASGITVDGSTKKFPRPSVNVKLLTMSLKDGKTTVYKGDPITPKAYADELTQALKIIELKENNPTTTVGIAPKDANGNPMFPALSDAQKNALANGKSITLGSGEEYEYIYPETTDAIGYFEYKFTGTENLGDHEAVKVGDKVEKYTVEVKFIPYSTAERQNRVSGVNVPNEAGGSNYNLEPITTTGTYTVNVIAGEIQIVKKVDKASEQDREFTFVITKDDKPYKEVTVTVEKNKTEGTYTGNDLKELPRGTYVVSEKLTSGYGVKEFSVVSDITNCQNSVDDAKDTAIFVMGNNISEEDVIAAKDYKNGIRAKVIYTNEEVIAQWNVIKRSSSSTEEAALYLGGAEFTLTSKDRIVYKGVSTEETGVIIWEKDGKEIECNELPAGTYILEETKAPQGYSLSREKWTIVLTKHGKLKTITSSTGKDIVKFEQQDGKISYYYDNTPIYDLPSTGHTGIFNILMSGILLMFAGILIIYKMKGKGVLKK